MGPPSLGRRNVLRRALNVFIGGSLLKAGYNTQDVFGEVTFEQPPLDHNHDGWFEDLTGDGTTDVTDVLVPTHESHEDIAQTFEYAFPGLVKRVIGDYPIGRERLDSFDDDPTTWFLGRSYPVTIGVYRDQTVTQDAADQITQNLASTVNNAMRRLFHTEPLAYDPRHAQIRLHDPYQPAIHAVDGEPVSETALDMFSQYLAVKDNYREEYHLLLRGRGEPAAAGQIDYDGHNIGIATGQNQVTRTGATPLFTPNRVDVLAQQALGYAAGMGRSGNTLSSQTGWLEVDSPYFKIGKSADVFWPMATEWARFSASDDDPNARKEFFTPVYATGSLAHSYLY